MDLSMVDESMSLSNTGSWQSGGSSIQHNGCFTPHIGGTLNAKKRRMEEPIMQVDTKENRGCCSHPVISQKRKFLAIPAVGEVYQTEHFKAKQTLLFHPITEDILINTRHIEQISFFTGQCFIADDSGNYKGTANQGDVIHFWRFSEANKQLYISRSLLFLNRQLYMTLRKQLEEL